MITASKLAGFFSAQAVWGISEGETLVPMLAYTDQDDKRILNRLMGEELGAAVAHGKQQLASNPMDANDAVLLYDGRITLGGAKVDAIIVEMRAYFSPQSEATLAIPYTPKKSGSAFRVHKPKLIVWKNCEDFDMNRVFQAFFEGVSGHGQGSKVWTAALDESI
jgi:hypothetical protein